MTLDSCRYDTFAAANVPALKSVGPLHLVHAAGNFTFSSHAAMFVGFTPGDASRQEAFVNPKYGKIFKMAAITAPSLGQPFVTLEGRSVMDGLRRMGYVTIGTGAVGWFDDRLPTAALLTRDFDRFWFSGGTWFLDRQLEFVDAAMADAGDRPVFVFLNVGETHVPYWHDGAAWDRALNPCVPFRPANDAEECRRRQRACLEYADGRLAPLLGRFDNIVVCADHGDAWGEDGLWEHGISHPKVLEVPLVFRLDRPFRRGNETELLSPLSTTGGET
ncbi:MAG: hypothetical protein ACRD0Q_04785 [Acidimicrobiales bacterium]